MRRRSADRGPPSASLVYGAEIMAFILRPVHMTKVHALLNQPFGTPDNADDNIQSLYHGTE